MAYVDWYRGKRNQLFTTPRTFFLDLHREYRFTLDGAASPGNALLTRASFEKRQRKWTGERVFCNPPWSNIAAFVELAATAEFACLLVPARTNVKWFHRALQLGATPRYWLGRLKFGNETQPCPVDCCLLLFGKA